MTPKSRPESPDEIMLRCVQRIAEGVEAVRWLLIVVCLLQIGLIAANLVTLL